MQPRACSAKEGAEGSASGRAPQGQRDMSPWLRWPVGVGQPEVVAHGVPEADLVQPEFWLAWQRVQESACGRCPTGCDGGLGLGADRRVSHETLVVVLLHDESKGTLELKTGRLREVGDVGEVVVSEAVVTADITTAQSCEDAPVDSLVRSRLTMGTPVSGSLRDMMRDQAAAASRKDGKREVDHWAGVSMMSDSCSSSSSVGSVSAMEPR